MLDRDTEIMRLRSATFDLLVVGAGVHGSAIACEAARQGARVALIDRADFASGASSNSLKILHGGFRYLQQLDVRRMRSSIRCRREWAQLAPELVKPLPCAIPASGKGVRSRLAFAAALCANEVISGDRNRGLSNGQRIPRGRLLSRAQYDAIAHDLLGPAHSGAALWWDALALDTEALVLGLIQRAATAGASVANYVEARELLVSANAVHGVVACDVESGKTFEIRAARTLCAGGAGPSTLTDEIDRRAGISRPSCWAVNVIVKAMARPSGDSTSSAVPASDVALAAAVPPGAGLPEGASGRQLFFVPWRGRMMIGTHYVAGDEGHDEAEQRRRAVRELMDLAQRAAPASRFQESDICFVHWGRLALSRPWRASEAPPLLNTPRLLDYGRRAALDGLWSIEGPKFTSALDVARWTVRRVLAGQSDIGPSHGRLSEIPRVTTTVAADPETAAARAARSLEARTLEDAVLRRTGIGSAGHPGAHVLEACARGMARSLGWSTERAAAEVQHLSNYYRERHCASGSPPPSSQEET